MNGPTCHDRMLFPCSACAHILLLLLLTGCITAGLLLIRRLKPSQAQHVLHGAAILVPLLELSHSVWLYLTGTTSLIKLLPLHLCGLQSLFIPLAVFTKFTCFRDFVYATSLLGGIFGTVMPAGNLLHEPKRFKEQPTKREITRQIS